MNRAPRDIESRVGLLDSNLVSDFVAVATPIIQAQPASAFQTRQTWEGVVTSVRDGEFVALLSDRTNPAWPDEEMVFEFGEVSPVEHRLIVLGAVFYVFIGTERTAGGTQKNVTTIKFRRLPVWTRSALHGNDARARDIQAVLGID